MIFETFFEDKSQILGELNINIIMANSGHLVWVYTELQIVVVSEIVDSEAVLLLCFKFNFKITFCSS